MCHMRRILFYRKRYHHGRRGKQRPSTFIYEGAANWQTANGVVTLRYPGNEDIIVRMDEYNNARRMCAIALLENDGGDGFSVEKQVSFFDGHAQMDKAYNWGLRWVPGRK